MQQLNSQEILRTIVPKTLSVEKAARELGVATTTLTKYLTPVNKINHRPAPKQFLRYARLFYFLRAHHPAVLTQFRSLAPLDDND